MTIPNKLRKKIIDRFNNYSNENDTNKLYGCLVAAKQIDRSAYPSIIEFIKRKKNRNNLNWNRIILYENVEAATRAWTEWRLFLVLFFAVGGDGFADKCGGAGSVFVDVILKTLVGDVHLAETREDFVGAGVVVFGDVILQFFH